MTALRATVTFQQIIVTNAVEISVAQKNTTAPQTTGKTTSGTKSTKTTPNSSAPSLGDKIKNALSIIGKDFQELFSSRWFKTINEIALTGDPNQTYTVSIAGETKNITFILNQSFNEQARYWVLSINDQSNNPIISDIPLLCGYDLLEQYQYLNIGHLLVVNISDQTIEYPNADNIAGNFELVWVL